VRNAIVFVVSTGVGGGIVSDGRLSPAVGQRRPPRSDDRRRHRGRAGGIHPRAACLGSARSPGRAQGWAGTTGEELADAYRAGDDVAVAAVARSAHAVGVGLTSAATLLDLELAVVGGGFSFVADDYPDRIERVVRDSAVNAYAGRLKVVRAGLGGDAPLIGAGASCTAPTCSEPPASAPAS
jgi:glucokinase